MGGLTRLCARRKTQRSATSPASKIAIATTKKIMARRRCGAASTRGMASHNSVCLPQCGHAATVPVCSAWNSSGFPQCWHSPRKFLIFITFIHAHGNRPAPLRQKFPAAPGIRVRVCCSRFSPRPKCLPVSRHRKQFELASRRSPVVRGGGRGGRRRLWLWSGKRCKPNSVPLHC